MIINFIIKQLFENGLLMNFLKPKRNQILLFIQFIACSIFYVVLAMKSIQNCKLGTSQCNGEVIILGLICAYAPLMISILLKENIPLKYKYLFYILSIFATLISWFIGFAIWILFTVGASV